MLQIVSSIAAKFVNRGCEGQESRSAPSPHSEQNSQIAEKKEGETEEHGGLEKKEGEAKERKGLERVKTEVCLSEEGKEEEEQWVEIWEEKINREGEAWDFQVKIGAEKVIREKEKVKKVKDLIDDFPNLKVGGLLPDPVPPP